MMESCRKCNSLGKCCERYKVPEADCSVWLLYVCDPNHVCHVSVKPLSLFSALNNKLPCRVHCDSTWHNEMEGFHFCWFMLK